MMYRYMTLSDKTEVNHSEVRQDGSVKVYMEKPIHLGFKSVECILPEYTWKNNDGFSEEELQELDEYIHSVAHIVMELAQIGGFENASGF